MSSRSLAVTAGARGIHIDVPDSIELLPIRSPADPAPVFSAAQQQELFCAALAKSESGSALPDLAKGHRHVAVVVGDLSQPAPYDILLPELIRTLVAAEIRPTRISFLAYPGNGAPILGRGAIRRYGEQTVGDHELRAWTWEADGPADSDPLFEMADLRIAVRPLMAGALTLPQAKPLDLDIRLELGKKLSLDVVSVRAFSRNSAPATMVDTEAAMRPESQVWISGGGGGDWEATLEEALLSFQSPALARTAVLAFSGEDGLGSARFVRELWGLLAEAEEVLARDGALPVPSENRTIFDPAGVVATALGQFENVVLFSPYFMEHSEGEDLADKLTAHPRVGARLQLCGSQASLWSALAKAHGDSYRLYVEPLGWRQNAL